MNCKPKRAKDAEDPAPAPDVPAPARGLPPALRAAAHALAGLLLADLLKYPPPMQIATKGKS